MNLMTETTNNPETFRQFLLPNGNAVKPEKSGPRVYTGKERQLLLLALGIGVLFDRLVFASGYHLPFFSSIFWLLFLVLFYLFNWERIRKSKVLWIVGGMTAALCLWSLLFDYSSAYGSLTTLVIPAVLMAHCQYFALELSLKDAGKLTAAWFSGWLIKPFSAIPVLFGALLSLGGGGKKSTLKKILIGVGLTIPLFMVILPLLAQADRVFGFFLEGLLWNFDLPAFVMHSLTVVLAAVLFYSYLWNAGLAPKPEEKAAKEEPSLDWIISCTVLGSVLLVYLLFCTVQFTYLFAGAGLPGGMTYSEYAREGFSQIILVCGINLALFGVFLRYGRNKRVVSILLAALLGLTAVMLFSGFVRLRLYISAYGLTWLRLISTWFILYLGAALLLCGVRMAREKLPLVGICAILLLGWYGALGYANPEALITRYNLNASGSVQAWAEEQSDLYYMPDDVWLALLEANPSPGVKLNVADLRGRRPRRYSLSCYRLERQLEDVEQLYVERLTLADGAPSESD